MVIHIIMFCVTLKCSSSFYNNCKINTLFVFLFCEMVEKINFSGEPRNNYYNNIFAVKKIV